MTILYSRLCRPPRVEAAPGGGGGGGGGGKQQQQVAGPGRRPRSEASPAAMQHPAEPLLSTGSEAEGAAAGGSGGGCGGSP